MTINNEFYGKNRLVMQKISQKVLESEFLKLRDIQPKKRKWDGLLIEVLTVVKN